VNNTSGHSDPDTFLDDDMVDEWYTQVYGNLIPREMPYLESPYVPHGEGSSSNPPPSTPMDVDDQSPPPAPPPSPSESHAQEPLAEVEPIHRSFTEIRVGTIPVLVQHGEFEKELYTSTGHESVDPPYSDRPRVMQHVKIGDKFVFVEVGPRAIDGNFPDYDPNHQIVLYNEPESGEEAFSPPRQQHEDDDYHPRSPEEPIHSEWSPEGSPIHGIPLVHQPYEFHQPPPDDDYHIAMLEHMANMAHVELEEEIDGDEMNDGVAPFTSNANDLIPIETVVPIIEESINRPQHQVGDVITIHNRVYRHISKPYDDLRIGPFRICGRDGPNLYILESMDGFRFHAPVHGSFLHDFRPP